MLATSISIIPFKAFATWLRRATRPAQQGRLTTAIYLLLCLVCVGRAAAAPMLLIDSEKLAEPVERYIDIYIDDTGELTAEAVLKPEYALNFAPLSFPNASFGFVDGTLWCRLKMTNTAEVADQYAMHFLPVNLELLKVYEVSSESGGRPIEVFSHQQSSGDNETRNAPGFFIPLGGLSPGASKQIILQIKSDYPVDLDATVYSSESVGTDMQNEMRGYYFMLGCMYMVVLAAIAGLVVATDIIFLYFAIYAQAVIGYFYNSWGFPSLFFGPEFAYSGVSYFFFSGMISLFLLLTIIRLINDTLYFQKIRTALYAVVVLNTLCLLALLFLDAETSFYLFYATALISAVIYVVALLPAYLEKPKSYLLLFLVSAFINLMLAVVSSITAVVDLSSLVTGSRELGFLSAIMATIYMTGLGLYVAEKKESRRFSDLRTTLLQEMSVQKSALLSQITAQLRSPTAAIVGANDLLRTTPLTGKQRELLRASDSSSNRLLQTIEDFRAHADLDSYQLVDNQRFSPLALLHGLLLQFQAEMVHRQIELKVETDSGGITFVNGDEPRIRHIIASLLTTRITQLRDAELHVRLSLNDRGMSLILSGPSAGWKGWEKNPEPVDDVVEQMSDDLIRQNSLLIDPSHAQRLTQKLGGSLSVSGEPESTLELSLYLPVDVAPIEVVGFAETNELQGLRVLLVQEDIIYRQLLERQFALWGCDVEVCAGLNAAQAHLRLGSTMDRPFELVLFDRNLLQSNRPDSIERLKNGFQLGDGQLAVLMLSTDYSMADSSLAAKLGVQRLIASPVDLRELRQIVLEVVFALQDTQRPQNSANLSAIRIMVIERDQLAADVMKLHLESLGINEPVVCDAASAMRTFQRQRFDMVMLACDVEDSDSFEWVELARDFEIESRRAAALVVGIVSHDDLDLRERAELAGVNKLLSRPIYPHELRPLLVRCAASPLQ